MAVIDTNDFGNGIVVAVVDHDPSSTATDVVKGSLIINQTTGDYFRKLDDGLTTSVTQISDLSFNINDMLVNSVGDIITNFNGSVLIK